MPDEAPTQHNPPPAESITVEEFDALLAIIRSVVPRWLRQHHQTLSLAGHAAEEIFADSESRHRFLTAFESDKQTVAAELWLKAAQRIRDRLAKRLSRRKERQEDAEAVQLESDIEELLEEIDRRLHTTPNAQVIFREFYIPLIEASRLKRPTIVALQQHLGTGVEWCREVRDRVERTIREVSRGE